MNDRLQLLLKEKQELELELEYAISEPQKERLEQELKELKHSINIVEQYSYEAR